MRMVAEQRIAAPKQKVWEALNDPETLRASIPGCESLEKESDVRFTATVAVKVGPIGARFKGAVGLEDLDPPNGYTLILEGNGGIAGSMKGAAKVKLIDDGGNTIVAYDVEAQVGGRMAQLGGPIIDATAKQLAGKFFGQFGDIVSGVKQAKPAPAKAVAAGATATATDMAVTRQSIAGSSDSRWAGIAIGLIIVLVAAAAFQFGRQSAAPVITIDKAVLEQLIQKTGAQQ
jgi:uncharacterized protein